MKWGARSETQEAFGVGGGGAGRFRRRFVAEFGQYLQDLRQILGAIVLAPVAGERDIRGIGLQNNRLLRQSGGNGPDASGPVIGEGSAQTDAEPELDILPGLLGAAAEGMDNPAVGKSLGPQGPHDLIMGLPDMEKDRQMRPGGDLQLPLEQLLLGRPVAALNIIIQTDLADGHQIRRAGQLLQLFQMAGAMQRQVHRVQAGGRIEPLVGSAELKHPVPAIPIHPRQDQPLHSRRPGPCQQDIKLRRECLDIEMAVGVD